jgi:hypothetical protein
MVRFFIDPTLSDAEIAKRIMQIAVEHYPDTMTASVPDQTPELDDLDSP